jgi:hypothetical protein
LKDAGRNYDVKEGFILPGKRIKTEDEFFSEISEAAKEWFAGLVESQRVSKSYEESPMYHVNLTVNDFKSELLKILRKD